MSTLFAKKTKIISISCNFSATLAPQSHWPLLGTYCPLPVWPLLASSPASCESPVSSGPVLLHSCVFAETPSDRCCRVWLSAPKQLGPVISAHWRWHHLTSVHLTHLPLSGFISRAPDTCFTSEALVHSKGGPDQWKGDGPWLQALSSVMPPGHAKKKRRWGKRAEAGDAARLIIPLWQVQCFPSVSQ